MHASWVALGQGEFTSRLVPAIVVNLEIYQRTVGVLRLVLAIEEHRVIGATAHGPVIAPGAGVREIPQRYAVD